MRWALLVASVVTFWHASPTHAWHAGVSVKGMSADNVLNGNQAVNVSVGCHAAVPYPTCRGKNKDTTKPRFTYVFENPIAEFISLHFKEFDLPPDDYIVLRATHASEHKASVTYSGRNQTGSFFSKSLFTKSVTLELYTQPSAKSSSSSSSCKGFAIDKYRFLADAASFESSQQETVCDSDESEEAACFRDDPEKFKRADSVARLLIHKDGSSYFCTGWLLGCEGHVITNHHCISNSTHAENTEFEFMAQGGNCSTKCAEAFGCPGTTRATTSTLVIANEDLDYTLVKVAGNLSVDYGYLQLREGGAKLNEKIYIPEHPAGWGKRIAEKDGETDLGRVLDLNRGGCLPDQVAYNLDTQGGSSGSPVISSVDNSVVALHHCGGCPNTAVNADKIIKDLRARNLLPQCAVFTP